MEITAEWLEEQIKVYEGQEMQHLASANACQGAAQAFRTALTRLEAGQESPEPVPKAP